MLEALKALPALSKPWAERSADTCLASAETMLKPSAVMLMEKMAVGDISCTAYSIPACQPNAGVNRVRRYTERENPHEVSFR